MWFFPQTCLLFSTNSSCQPLKKHFFNYIYKLWFSEEVLKFKASEWKLRVLDSEPKSEYIPRHGTYPSWVSRTLFSFGILTLLSGIVLILLLGTNLCSEYYDCIVLNQHKRSWRKWNKFKIPTYSSEGEISIWQKILVFSPDGYRLSEFTPLQRLNWPTDLSTIFI